MQRSILENCAQVVIYGANGWMGRSAIDFISSNSPKMINERVLLIGSKPGTLRINNVALKVLDPLTGFLSIKENAIFFNAAFLRREFLQQMSVHEYRNKNEQIVNLAKKAIKEKNILSFINLSSGAARDLDYHHEIDTVDEYSKMKKHLEFAYSEVCRESQTSFVNCRIYNLTGKYLNEFKNLALSSFINQIRAENRIEVKSPTAKRTYVDSISLAGTLLSVASYGKNAFLDSGGNLVTMLEMAQSVATTLGNAHTEVIAGNDISQDYYGDYESFNSLANNLGQNLAGINNQILETIKAFN